MQTARARAGKVLAVAPLDDGDIDARQRQLARQHQPRRAASGYHHRMFGHTPPPSPWALVSPGDSAARPESCRKRPVRYTLRMARSTYLSSPFSAADGQVPLRSRGACGLGGSAPATPTDGPLPGTGRHFFSPSAERGSSWLVFGGWSVGAQIGLADKHL